LSELETWTKRFDAYLREIGSDYGATQTMDVALAWAESFIDEHPDCPIESEPLAKSFFDMRQGQ
jgi:hypothetical protein